MSSTSGSIGGIPSMPYLDRFGSWDTLTDVQKKKVVDSEQQLDAALSRVNALNINPSLQSKLQASYNLLRTNFTTILGIKYSTDPATIIANMSPTDYLALKQQLEDFQKAVADLQSDPAYLAALSNYNDAKSNLDTINAIMTNIPNINSFSYSVDTSNMNLSISSSDQQIVDAGKVALASLQSKTIDAAKLDTPIDLFNQLTFLAKGGIDPLPYQAPLLNFLKIQSPTYSDLESLRTAINKVKTDFPVFDVSVILGKIDAAEAGMNILYNNIQAKIAADQNIIKEVELTKSLISSYETSIADLQPQVDAAKEEYEAGVAVFNTLSSTEKDLLTQLYDVPPIVPV